MLHILQSLLWGPVLSNSLSHFKHFLKLLISLIKTLSTAWRILQISRLKKGDNKLPCLIYPTAPTQVKPTGLQERSRGKISWCPRYPQSLLPIGDEDVDYMDGKDIARPVLRDEAVGEYNV